MLTSRRLLPPDLPQQVYSVGGMMVVGSHLQILGANGIFGLPSVHRRNSALRDYRIASAVKPSRISSITTNNFMGSLAARRLYVGISFVALNFSGLTMRAEIIQSRQIG